MMMTKHVGFALLISAEYGMILVPSIHLTARCCDYGCFFFHHGWPGPGGDAGAGAGACGMLWG